MRLAFSTWVVLAAVVNITVVQAQPVLKFDNGSVRVIGLTIGDLQKSASISDEQWKLILSVYTHEAHLKKINQPVSGRYKARGNEIWFEPEFPFVPGATYHVTFSPEAFSNILQTENRWSSEPVDQSFSVKSEYVAGTFIESVYPDAEKLPENLLRMYIHFSAPMMPGEAYQHIHLFRRDGTPVKKAFLIVDQELWDAERKRFTLLFDPGRIKRDLKSNLELGPPLREGETYHLVIDSAWRDLHGRPLEKSLIRTFTAAASDRDKVPSGSWLITSPAANSRDEVTITFDRPMDRALALKHIRVSSSNGSVEGHSRMLDDYSWEFTPAEPWLKGEYQIDVNPLLEDVAGNNLNNPFDLDLSAHRRITSDKMIQIPLVIRSLR